MAPTAKEMILLSYPNTICECLECGKQQTLEEMDLKVENDKSGIKSKKCWFCCQCGTPMLWIHDELSRIY